MEIKLTWNLFIGGVFVLIMAYSIIIGKNQTLKIIIATYLSALAADGLANLFYKYFMTYSPLAKSISGPLMDKYFLFFKILMFIILIVLVVTKGEFKIRLNGGHFIIKLTTNVIFGALSATLLIGIMLFFMTGGKFLNFDVSITNQLAEIYKNSKLVRIVVNNFNIWFSLPIVLFIIDSIINSKDKSSNNGGDHRIIHC